MMSIFRSRAALVIVSAVGGAALAGGVSVAMAAGANPTIYACKNTTTGALRVVAKQTTCASGETPLSWNKQGPAGATGPAGAGVYEMQYPIPGGCSTNGSDYSGCANVGAPPGYVPYGNSVALNPANYPPGAVAHMSYGDSSETTNAGTVCTRLLLSATLQPVANSEACVSIPSTGSWEADSGNIVLAAGTNYYAIETRWSPTNPGQVRATLIISWPKP
jgi:hypothetical protein